MSYRLSLTTLYAVRFRTAEEIAAQRARNAENERAAAAGRAREAAALAQSAATRAPVLPVAPVVAVEPAPVTAPAQPGMCEKCRTQPATHGSFVKTYCAECFEAACAEDKRRGRVCSFCHAAWTACTC